MSEWIEAPLGDVADIYSGGTPSRINPAYWDGEIPWVTPSDITSCKTNYLFDTQDSITMLGLAACSATLLPVGTLLLTSRATIGEVRMARRPIATNQGFKCLVPKGIDGKFLFYQCLLKSQQFRRFAAGSTFLEINKKDTARISIPYPNSPDEQAEIGRVLETIDQTIEKTEALIEKYQQIKAGLMNDLFTRGVGTDGKLRPPREQAPELYQETPIGWIPKEWGVCGIMDVCDEVFLGLTTKVDYVTDGGVALVRATNINGGKLSFDDALFISEKQHRELTRYRKAKFGDVLVSKSGSLGVCALVDQEREFSIYESIIVLQPKSESLHSEFLLWLMRHDSTQRRLLGETVGSTVGHLNLLDFRRLLVPMVPYKEQGQIAAQLKSYQKKLDNESEQAKKLKEIKSGLMHDLLTGKVSVKVDPPHV